MTGHVALLGDSIFDNHAYTGGQPDVLSHFRRFLPADWRASLLAVDGAVCLDVPRQLVGLDNDVTHLVVSMGGNDALLNLDMLDLPVTSTGEALLLFGRRVARFEQAYRSALLAITELRRPLIACTIYNGNLGPRQAPAARVALSLFNDVISRVAGEYNADLIDLRRVCTLPSDYANPIEPSGPGGQKIALAIAEALGLVGRH